MKSSPGERIFYAINYLFLFVLALSCLAPMLHVLSLSLSDQASVMSGIVGIWPEGFTLSTYREIIQGTHIMTGFRNSVIITLVGTSLNMLMTVTAAYPLSRHIFIFRRGWSLIIIFTMLFGGGLIPMFILIKSLGLINSYWALWLPGAINAYNLLVLKSFFESIPEELVEAARIDGCREWRLLVNLFLPLSMPAIAALSLFYGVAHWNNFNGVLYYITDVGKQNLSVMVQQMIANQQLLAELTMFGNEDVSHMTSEGLKSAAIFITMIPLLVAYLSLQKYFVKGVMIGSVKG